MSSSLYPHISERAILWIVGLIQFVNILDFMMVMPLGPDFAHALGMHDSDLGWVGGSYTAAAAVSGVICSLFIDRFDRKKAIIVAFGGLMVATALGGCAWSFASLLASRILAGIFGGPATSLAWAIVADVVEPARRGQAMSKIMSAFSLAAVFGVPFGLEVAHLGNWATPFFSTAAIGFIVILLTMKLMPQMKAHLEHVHTQISLSYLLALLAKPINRLTYLYVFIAMIASFTLIPNLSAYVQYNMQYPRADLGWLYSVGGVVSFITVQMTGRIVDRFNSFITSFISMTVFIIVLWVSFIMPVKEMSAMAFFMITMFAMGMRNVSSTTLATKIPPPQERAGFMSLFSCVQGMGMACGAFLSTRMLSENADKSLNGMDHIAMLSIVMSLMVPMLIWMVERRLRKPQ